MAWIDVTRGVLIVLVVLFHVTGIFTVPLVPAGSPTAAFLDSMVAAMRPFRMPLFFLVSGYLATSAISRSWGGLLRSKTAFFFAVYLLWYVIQTVVESVTAAGRPTAETESASMTGMRWLDVILGGTIAPAYLWFLFALAVYFPAAKLLSRFGAWPLLPAAVVYLLSVQEWPDVALNQLPAVVSFFFWFFLGTLAKAPMAWLAERVRVGWVVVAVLVFGAAQLGELLIGSRTSLLLGVASLAASVMGLSAAGVIGRSIPGLRRPLAALGRMTLPIYVIHMPIVWLLQWLTAAVVPEPFIESAVVALAVDLVVTALVVLLSVGVYRVLRKPAGWLFSPPLGWLDRRSSSVPTP